MDFESGMAEVYALRRRGLDGDAGAYITARMRLADLMPMAIGTQWPRLMQALGQIERDEGHTDAARAAYSEAVAMWRGLRDNDGLADALRHFADISREAGDPEGALPLIKEAVGLLAGSDALTRANALRVLALCHEALGLPARQTWREAQALYRQAGIDAGVEECGRHLAVGAE